MRRLWKELIEGYRYVAYWTPPVWAFLWESRRAQSLDGAPWWGFLVGPLLAILAIACTLRLEQEPSPPTLS